MNKLSKSKTVKHNKVPIEREKEDSSPKIIDFYTDMMYFKQVPVAIGFLKRLALDWVEWAKLDDSLRMSDFYLERNITEKTMHRWMEKHDFMREAHAFVKARIASRRDKGAITRKYDASYIDKHQTQYDADWRKEFEWRAKIGDEGKEGSGTFILQMVQAPSSPEVPERNKE
jgi:hypothetical protein